VGRARGGSSGGGRGRGRQGLASSSLSLAYARYLGGRGEGGPYRRAPTRGPGPPTGARRGARSL